MVRPSDRHHAATTIPRAEPRTSRTTTPAPYPLRGRLPDRSDDLYGVLQELSAAASDLGPLPDSEGLRSTQAADRVFVPVAEVRSTRTNNSNEHEESTHCGADKGQEEDRH
jgi:hypothetical protein